MERVGEDASVNNDDLYHIALLIDHLKHEDLQLRLNSTRNLSKIASALGAERTRDELLPFLSEGVDDDEVVMVAMAEQLGDFTPLVGGADYVYSILPSMELLLSGEESYIRNAAVLSMEKVIASLSDAQLLKIIIPFVIKLASSEWYTTRISAALLCRSVYRTSLSKSMHDIKSAFIKLCCDGTSSVRRIAAYNFGDFMQHFLDANSIPDILTVFKGFSIDDQDAVRIQVIHSCVTLGSVAGPEARAKNIVPVCEAIGNDKSWRVRWSFANQLHDIFRTFRNEIESSNFVNMFENLLNDSEGEVRAAASSKISLVCHYIDKTTVISKILPIVHHLVTDHSEFVRSSLASSISGLAGALGKDDTVEYLLPTILLFLRDEVSEVRLGIIANLEAINRVIGVELLGQSLLPSIADLGEDHKWRVRLAIIQHIPKLAFQLGHVFFNEKLIGLCIAWLSDHVFSVRKAAIDNIKKLCHQFGEEWTREQVLPSIERMLVHTNYLRRMTALYCIQSIVEDLSPSVIDSIIVPLLIPLSNDGVANVRFTLAKTLHQLSSVVQKNQFIHESGIVSCLVSLGADVDRDVKCFTNEALIAYGAKIIV